MFNNCQVDISGPKENRDWSKIDKPISRRKQEMRFQHKRASS